MFTLLFFKQWGVLNYLGLEKLIHISGQIIKLENRWNVSEYLVFEKCINTRFWPKKSERTKHINKILCCERLLSQWCYSITVLYLDTCTEKSNFKSKSALLIKEDPHPQPQYYLPYKDLYLYIGLSSVHNNIISWLHNTSNASFSSSNIGPNSRNNEFEDQYEQLMSHQFRVQFSGNNKYLWASVPNIIDNKSHYFLS